MNPNKPKENMKSIADKLKEEIEIEDQQQKQESIAPIPQQRISIQNPQSNEQGFLVEYVDTGVRESVYFFQSIFGVSYKGRYKAGYDQKQKIIRYIFLVNNQLQDKMQEQERKFRYQYNADEQSLSKTTKQNIRQLEHLKLINRVQLVRGLSESRNRIGVLGYSWGAFTGCFLHITFFRNVSYWRRLALWVTVFHSSGQIINYLNQDRFFDKVYPIYQDDLKQYKRNIQLKKQNEGQQVGKIKMDEIDRLFAEVRTDLFLEFEQPIKK